MVPPSAAWVGAVVPGLLAEPARVGGPGTILGEGSHLKVTREEVFFPQFPEQGQFLIFLFYMLMVLLWDIIYI